MISSINGPVLSQGAGWVVIGVGGLGYRVEVPAGRGPSVTVGDHLSLVTSLIVREDSLTLFGFHEDVELELFTRLLSVSGVGPRMALGVLSALAPTELVEAVKREDEKPFKKVSGVGPKTAKLIVVSLAGKLDGLQIELRHDAAESADPGVAVVAAVAEGLVGLGWRESDAQQAAQDALDAGAPASHAGLLRAALALLQSNRGVGR